MNDFGSFLNYFFFYLMLLNSLLKIRFDFYSYHHIAETEFMQQSVNPSFLCMEIVNLMERCTGKVSQTKESILGNLPPAARLAVYAF